MFNMTFWRLILIDIIVILTLRVNMASITQPQIEYEWAALKYDWQSTDIKQRYMSNGQFNVDNNVITGVKVYDGKVYVTVPRWRSGVPSTLNLVVNDTGEPILHPFPNWKMQTIGNCDAFQFVQSMEIDPNTGWMWLIDTGRIHFFDSSLQSHQNLCPAKIVIYDIKTKNIIRRYDFPVDVVSNTTNFLNDIVLDYVNGKAAYAYITDVGDSKIVVYDFVNNSSYYFRHHSMMSESGNGTITTSGGVLNTTAPIDGIAMTADFRFVYYCSLGGYSLYQIPTSTLRTKGNFSEHVRKVGYKVSQTDGMVYGQNNLYYGALSINAIYKWHVLEDSVNGDFSAVSLKTQTKVYSNNTGIMQWVDTFAFDSDGFLWFTVNKLDSYFSGSLNFNDSSVPNMFVCKIYVGETGYLEKAAEKTTSSSANLKPTCNTIFLILVATITFQINNFVKSRSI